MATVAAVAASDLVTTISAAFARRFADALGLVLTRPPFDDTLEMTMVAMKRRAADPAMQWFRRLLREEAAAVYADEGTESGPEAGSVKEKARGSERPSRNANGSALARE